MTLREYINFWQETYDKHQTLDRVFHLCGAQLCIQKTISLPGLGDTQISELTSEMVGEFLEERKRFGNPQKKRFWIG